MMFVFVHVEFSDYEQMSCQKEIIDIPLLSILIELHLHVCLFTLKIMKKVREAVTLDRLYVTFDQTFNNK